jgi:DNA polymerase-3 subunit delta'
MTKEAQNCLLKTLEEPPEFVTIILVSSNENLILNTIKSRCTSVKFNNIDENLLKKYIEENLEYEELTENLLRFFDGSIGKAIKIQEKKEKFLEIEKVIKSVKQKNIIDFVQDAKVLYDKENIIDILDYIIVCLYDCSKEDKRFLNCISYVNESIARLKSNAYLDMNIDVLLFKIWGEINENSNRS